MSFVWQSVIAGLAVSAAPAALAAQNTGFSMSIEGAKQGMFPGGKGGSISGLRFSYLLKSPRDLASGQATGKRQHSPVVFTKLVGTASPQIFAAVATNEVLKLVAIDVPGEGGSYSVKLTNATVAEVKQYTEVLNGRSTVLEDVSFTFQKIEVQDPGTKSMAVDDWMLGK